MVGALERASHGGSAARYVRIKKSERREKKVVRGWRAWARPHGRVAVRPCVFLYPLPHGIFCRTPPYGIFCRTQRKHSAFFKREGRKGWKVVRGWRAWARLVRQMRHATYNGSPLHSVHALLPPFFSLISGICILCLFTRGAAQRTLGFAETRPEEPDTDNAVGGNANGSEH